LPPQTGNESIHLKNSKKMADKIKLHPITPHQKRIFEIADRIKAGDIMLFPSDTQYALGCLYDNKKGLDRIRQMRRLDANHLFTLICESLTGVARFAQLSDDNFKLIKRLIPGPYTFVLPATKDVPRLLLNPKRKTIGFRVPDYPICESIIKELGVPLLAASAKLPEDVLGDSVAEFPDDLFHQFDRLVDLVIDNEQPLNPVESTVIDMTGSNPVIIREGEGFDKVVEVFSKNNVKFDVNPSD
jgi:tRNA threonylcarbamoyl adenosine modification protein (Sua5/YciO/YrdC/YwlC family)